MLSSILFLVFSVVPAIAAVTSGLYHISSKYFLQDFIAQDGNDIGLRPFREGGLEQLWSVLYANNTATIQNVGTQAFLSVHANGTVVARVKPYNWIITPDTPSGAGIVSNGKAVGASFEEDPLGIYESDGTNLGSLWDLTPVVPPPHAYRVWNQATNRYLDQDLGKCGAPGSCVLASAFNASSRSQVWHVSGTSSCGGRPILQNAASKGFLASGPDWSHTGTEAYLSPEPYPWAYGFVGGQLTLNDKDRWIEDITTLTVFEGLWVGLYASSGGPGTAPEQTWVFVPVYSS